MRGCVVSPVFIFWGHMYSAKLMERCRDGVQQQSAEEQMLWG
jgi:hypothetical protein